DHELHQVFGAQARELLVTVARFLSGAGSLDVDDPHHPLVDSLERHRSARLQRDAPAGIAESSQKRQAALLSQRLAARHADVAAAWLPAGQLLHSLHYGL